MGNCGSWPVNKLSLERNISVEKEAVVKGRYKMSLMLHTLTKIIQIGNGKGNGASKLIGTKIHIF
eukprot:scaffold88606_cov24-Attheya_sp.AAC.1